MRRQDKEISDESIIQAIIEESRVCRLGMVDGNKPYIVPLCFGYSDNVLYFHGSLKGKKIDLLHENPNVCFEFDLLTETIESDIACDWSMKYRSIVGFGKATFIKDLDEKHKAISTIIGRYSDRPLQLPEGRLKGTVVIKVEIESLTGKQSGF